MGPVHGPAHDGDEQHWGEGIAPHAEGPHEIGLFDSQDDYAAYGEAGEEA